MPSVEFGVKSDFDRQFLERSCKLLVVGFAILRGLTKVKQHTLKKSTNIVRFPRYGSYSERE